MSPHWRGGGGEFHNISVWASLPSILKYFNVQFQRVTQLDKSSIKKLISDSQSFTFSLKVFFALLLLEIIVYIAQARVCNFNQMRPCDISLTLEGKNLLLTNVLWLKLEMNTSKWCPRFFEFFVVHGFQHDPRNWQYLVGAFTSKRENNNFRSKLQTDPQS
jgi:hypothetical protein